MFPPVVTTAVFAVSSGCFYLEDHDGNRALIARGYSGSRDARNNPERQREPAYGPIPIGEWKISPPWDHPRLGKIAFPLVPCPGTETFGRSAFLIHGDNSKRDFSASTGCIILDRPAREAIRALGCKFLTVER